MSFHPTLWCGRHFRSHSLKLHKGRIFEKKNFVEKVIKLESHKHSFKNPWRQFFITGVSICENRFAFNWKTSNYLGSNFYQNQTFWSCLNFFIKSTIMELDANMSFYAEVLSVETLHFVRNQFLFIYSTGGSSSSCEMIILRNKSNGKIIWVCMGIFTTAFRNKKNTYSQILTKNTSSSTMHRF